MININMNSLDHVLLMDYIVLENLCFFDGFKIFFLNISVLEETRELDSTGSNYQKT